MLQLSITPTTASQDDLVKAVSILNSYIHRENKPVMVAPGGLSMTIAPDDNPAAGSPDAREAFTGAAEQSTLDPVAAFGTPPIVAQGFTTDPGNAQAAAVPTAPAAAAASAPAPGTNNAPAVDLDKNGLPWDSRIHASSRAKNADKSWRNKRGVDPATLATVEAELRAVMAAPAPATLPNVPPPPPAAGSPAAPAPSSPVAALPAASVAPSPATLPNVPPPPAATSQASPAAPPSASANSVPASASGAPAPIGYPELAQRITAGLAGKTLTPEQIAGACQSVGVPAFPLLATRPDLVPSVAAALGFA